MRTIFHEYGRTVFVPRWVLAHTVGEDDAHWVQVRPTLLCASSGPSPGLRRSAPIFIPGRHHNGMNKLTQAGRAQPHSHLYGNIRGDDTKWLRTLAEPHVYQALTRLTRARTLLMLSTVSLSDLSTVAKGLASLFIRIVDRVQQYPCWILILQDQNVPAIDPRPSSTKYLPYPRSC